MKHLIIAFLILAATMAVGVILAEKKVATLRARRLYPKKGNETEEDVFRLLELGEQSLAIRCYRSLHKVSLREAKDHVLSLRKNGA